MISLAIGVIRGEGLAEASIIIDKILRRCMCLAYVELTVPTSDQVDAQKAYIPTTMVVADQPVMVIVLAFNGTVQTAAEKWNAFVQAHPGNYADPSPEDAEGISQLLLNWLPSGSDEYDDIVRKAEALFP